jgi:ascorbate-specific PTS system EIIC-type component UlaA
MSGRSSERPQRPRFHKAYSFGLVTGAFFLLSWLGQFLFQMVVVRNEAEQHGQAFAWSDFLPQFFSSTLENWAIGISAAGVAGGWAGAVLLLGLLAVQEK